MGLHGPGYTAEYIEGVLLGGVAPQLYDTRDLEAIATDLRGGYCAPFADPSKVAAAVGLSVLGWSTAFMAVMSSRIFVPRGASRREVGTMVALGIAVASLRDARAPFGETDAAVLCCELVMPARAATGITISEMARVQPHVTVGVLAAWACRCRATSVVRRKMTGTISGA